MNISTVKTALACLVAAMTLTACPDNSKKGGDDLGDGGVVGDIGDPPPDFKKQPDLTGVPIDADLAEAPADMTDTSDLVGADLTVVAQPDMVELPPDLIGADFVPGPEDMTPPMDDPPVLTGTLYWVEIEDSGSYAIRRKDLPDEVPVTVLGAIESTTGVDVVIAARGTSVVFLVDGEFKLIANANVAIDGGATDPIVTDLFTCPAPNEDSRCANPLLGDGVLIYKLFEFDGSGDLINVDFFSVAMTDTQTPTKIVGLSDAAADVGLDTLTAQITDDGTKVLHNQYPYDFTSPTPVISVVTLAGGAATQTYTIDDLRAVGFHQGTTNEVLHFIDLPFGTGDSTLGRLTYTLTSNGTDYGVFPLGGPNPLQMRGRNGSVIMLNDAGNVQAFNLSSVFATMNPVELADVAPLGNFEWVP